jgi:23S rRNA pseudouridine955/2504/2580 synthase
MVSISEDQAGQRIDNFLLALLKGVPKTRIYKMVRKGEVRVNKGRCKPEYKLLEGDEVRVPPVHTNVSELEKVQPGTRQQDMLENAILFEDENLMVLNKPAGVAVHGGSGLSFGVIEILRSMRKEHDFLELVHRLDRDTSGCLLVAKNRKTLRWLHACLREDRVNKVYHAAVFGRWPNHKKIIDAPLKKNELKSGERVVKVDQEGKASQTKFRVIAVTKGFSLVEAKPITGRTHQIRVHCTHAGYAIVGDEKYATSDELEGFKSAYGKPRLMLHAAKIEFPLINSEKRVSFGAEYDPLFQSVLDCVGLVVEKDVVIGS